MSKTLFERIIAREIPAKIEHEDELCIVLKKALPRIGAATNDDQALLGHLLLTAGNLAKKLQLANGFRLVVNNGPDGGESVPHLHVHLLARRPLTWPPG